MIPSLIFIAGNWRKVFVKVSGKVKETSGKFKSKVGQVTVISHHSQDSGSCAYWKIGVQWLGMRKTTIPKETWGSV